MPGRTLIPCGMDSTTGQYVQPAARIDALQVAALFGRGDAPAITLGGAAGSGATVSIQGTNVSGIITFTTGLSLLSIGKVMTLTYANGWQFPGGSVVTFAPGNAAFCLAAGRLYAVSAVTGVSTLR